LACSTLGSINVKTRFSISAMVLESEKLRR